LPRIKSAKKRVLVTERNRQRNMAYKSAVRTAIKKVLLGATAEERTESLKQAYSIIDRAVLKGILHKNTAARCKSRISHAVLRQSAAA
jgi:small subunit ribosomal protein S20